MYILLCHDIFITYYIILWDKNFVLYTKKQQQKKQTNKKTEQLNQCFNISKYMVTQ